jgi:uncharacterized C2H2 Zn-finger protein
MGNCKMTNSVYRDSNVYQHENKHHLFLHIETIKCLKRKKKRTNKQNQLFYCWSLKYELYSKKTFRWPLNSCKLLLQCQDTLVQFGSFLSWSWKCVIGLLWHYYIKMSYIDVHLLHMHIVFYRERMLHQLVCGNAWLVYLHLEGASQILLYSTALTGNYQTGPKYLDTVIEVYMNLKVTWMSFYCIVHI